MNRPASVLPLALAFIALPGLVLAGTAAHFHWRDRDDHAVMMIAGMRSYSIHVPASYDSAKPTPLVLTFHGAGLTGSAQQALSAWDAVADREGFIVVYPTAREAVVPGYYQPRRRRSVDAWRVAKPMEYPGAERMLPADVFFIRGLIEHLKKRYNVDSSRIYANGLSNGGGMSWLLSCTLSDQIAAVGLVGAAYTIETSWCATRPPVPAIMFHGTADAWTKYHGGKVFIAPRPFPSIPAVSREWAGRNHCGAYTDSSVAPDVSRRRWHNCVADLELYTIEGGGHTWPGGPPLIPAWFAGRTTQSIDASALMWEFFREHPLH